MRPNPDGSLPPHQPHCMGCGPENPASTNLRLRIDGDRVLGTVTFDRRQEGAPGIVHGGAVATVLDDTLGSALIIVRRPAVTANLEIDFRAPALLGRELEVEGWCDRIEGRKVHLRGRLIDGASVVAEARALFVEVDLDHFRRGGQELPERWRDWKPAAPETT
ncbi:MAG TPA: PaaI family thioesterase [Thermoleophilaceae bacterium]|nr:PaaI family thioesterase [Thermoleophilaceae bacterium]